MLCSALTQRLLSFDSKSAVLDCYTASPRRFRGRLHSRRMSPVQVEKPAALSASLLHDAMRACHSVRYRLRLNLSERRVRLVGSDSSVCE